MTDYDGILTISGGRTKRANAGDSVNIRATLRFEGSTENDHETDLAFTDPTADRTITFPDASGTVLLDNGTQNIDLADDVKLLLGTDDDLEIYHNNSSGKNIVKGTGGINILTGDLQIKTLNGSTEVARIHSGAIQFNDAYTFPTSDGSENQVLQTDGSGALSFATVSGGSGIASVAADDTPQLGGDLYVNGNKITTSGGGNIVIDGTSGGGYIDITSNASSGHIFLRPQNANARVGIGDGFTPGSSSPVHVLHVKDNKSSNSSFITSIENENTGSNASLLSLVLNTSSEPSTSNKFISFVKSSGEDGNIAGDGEGGITFDSSGSLTLDSSTIKMKDSSSNIVGAFDTSGRCFYIGDTSSLSGQQALKVAESATGAPGVVFFHNTNNNNSVKVLTLKGGNTSSGSSTSTKFIEFFSGTDSNLGEIRADGHGGVEYITNFTGKHPTVIQSSESNILGLIVESNGTLWANASVSTAIPKVNLSSSNNSKKVFGVISSLESEYAGYASKWGVGESESQITVNSLGEGKVWVTNINGNIENGDYVTTSEISGHGRLQGDDLLHNYTVAKCTETVVWSSVSDTINHNGVDYKKYLIGCTYHCG
jgi:hypothetical protein